MMIKTNKKKISTLIKECRREMRNDLYVLHTALNTGRSDSASLDVKPANRASLSTGRRHRRCHRSQSGFNTSDFFYKCNNVSYKHVRRNNKFASRNLHKSTIRQASRDGYTYKHYDLYLLIKNVIESCRQTSMSDLRHHESSNKNIVLEKSQHRLGSLIEVEARAEECETMFEPQYASSPIFKDQKTSTPQKNAPADSHMNRIFLHNASRLKYFNSFDDELQSTRSNNNNKEHTYQNVFECNQLTNTSTPKTVRKFEATTSVENIYENLSGSNQVHCPLVPKNSTVLSTRSSVSSAFKCCILPFKNLIKSRAIKKRLREM